MRRRLVTTYVLLLSLVLLATEVPLAVALVNRETQRLVADRLADATRFAALAAPAIRGGELGPVRAELGRYHELYGIDVVLVDQDRRILSRSGTGPQSADAEVALRGALAGRQVNLPAMIWPWQSRDLVVAVPVSDGGAVLGGVLVVSPTQRGRRAILSAWAWLGLVGVLAVIASLVAASRLARWVLRPVTKLDAAAHEIAAGDSAARVPFGLGPPELRRLSQSFNEMADSVADALERQRSFVAHASHQLRNPLTVLRLRVEDLGTRFGTNSTGGEEHALALAEIDRLSAVLDSLLALAGAERDTCPRAMVDAAAAAAERVAAWRLLADRRGIGLTAIMPAGPAPALVVPTALDQILDALIDNALKFTGAGGTVAATVRREADEVVVSVVDNGPGLTEEECLLATERFWRAPRNQNVDGAGLGLPIVAVLVAASAGKLSITPARPRGLAVQMRFAAAREPADTEPADTEPADTEPATNGPADTGPAGNVGPADGTGPDHGASSRAVQGLIDR